MKQKLSENTEKNCLNDKLNFINEQIGNTPFSVIGNKDQGYMVVCGIIRTSDEIFDTVEKAKESLKIDWNTITALVVCTAENIKKLKNVK